MGRADRPQKARALDVGTWDFIMVLLSTPSGVINLNVTYPDLWLSDAKLITC